MKIKSGVVIKKMGNEHVVYDSDSSMIHELNEVGYKIIYCISEMIDKKLIVEKITEEFEVSKDQAVEEVEEFFELLKKKDLIV